MEMHQLRYFLAVAKTGNFSRAAEECHVAQPSLSQQILKLEDELGEPLFERLRSRAVLTVAGELLRKRAETILKEAEQARREVGDLNGEIRGKVTLGVIPTIAPYLLPSIARGFIKSHPRVELVMHEEITPRLLSSLESNELDLAIMSQPFGSSRIHMHQLFTEELLLVLPAGHPLLKKTRISLDDLAPEKFILMQEGHCLGDQALQFCREGGFHPQITCRSAQVETIQGLVQAGLGVSLIPAMARKTPCPRQLEYRSISGKKPTRSITLHWQANRQFSRAATALKSYLDRFAGN